MSYKDSIEQENMALGHSYNCAYVAGGDCLPPCPKAAEYGWDEEIEVDASDAFDRAFPEQAFNRQDIPDETESKPCCDNPECSGYPDPKCDVSEECHGFLGCGKSNCPKCDIPF